LSSFPLLRLSPPPPLSSGLPDGTIATASTGREQQGQIVDVQIRLWKEGRVVKSIRDHEGKRRTWWWWWWY